MDADEQSGTATDSDVEERQGRSATNDPTGGASAPAPSPYTAPPVSAAPAGGGEDISNRVASSSEPAIALSGTQTLTPYGTGWTEWRQEQVKFNVSVKAPSLSTAIWIYKTDGTQLSKDAFTTGNLLLPGDHPYAWDGYSDGYVLDTTVLRASPLYASVSTWDGHDAHMSQRIQLTTKTVKAKWADVKVDLRAHTVDVTVYVMFMTDPVLGISSAGVGKVGGLIKDGIGKYWSRAIQVNYRPWTVRTQAVERAFDCVPYMLLRGLAKRCFNPGAIIPGANIVFFYNESSPPYDEGVRETGAHEFGHSVLYEAHDVGTSVTHKGSSTVGQDPGKDSPMYPMSGEIDLMRYYNDLPDQPGVTNGSPNDYYARVMAVEDDVKGLVSVAGVEFS
jgi:hypothetical protein